MALGQWKKDVQWIYRQLTAPRAKQPSLPVADTAPAMPFADQPVIHKCLNAVRRDILAIEGYDRSHSDYEDANYVLMWAFEKFLPPLPLRVPHDIDFHRPFAEAVRWHALFNELAMDRKDVFPKLHDAYMHQTRSVENWFFGFSPFQYLGGLSFPIIIPAKAREAHHWICGSTGTGKTSLMEVMLDQDFTSVARGECSVAVIEPKSTLSKRIINLARFSTKGDLLNKLIYLQPSIENPIALSPFDPGPLEGLSSDDAQMLRSQAFQQLGYVFSSLGIEATANQSAPFTAALKLCSIVPGATINTLIEVLAPKPKDELPYPEYIAKLDQSTQSHFQTVWNQTNTKARRQEIIAKLDVIMQTSPHFSRMFSAPKTKIDLYKELHQKQQILVLNTDEARLGDGSGVLGAFFVSLIYIVAMRRYLVPSKERKPIFVYIDEAGSYIGNHPQAKALLTKAREAGVHLIIANQNWGDFKKEMQDAVMGNTAIKFVNTRNPSDAAILSRAVHATKDTMSVSPDDLTFAAFIPPNKEPVPITVPPLIFENAAKIPPGELDQIKWHCEAMYCWTPPDEGTPPPTSAPPSSAPPPTPQSPPDRFNVPI